MGVDETLLEEIVRRILEVARPDKIILFGSAATGQMTKDSDIDLLIVVACFGVLVQYLLSHVGTTSSLQLKRLVG